MYLPMLGLSCSIWDLDQGSILGCLYWECSDLALGYQGSPIPKVIFRPFSIHSF